MLLAVLFEVSAISKLEGNLGSARSELEKGLKESHAAKEPGNDWDR